MADMRLLSQPHYITARLRAMERERLLSHEGLCNFIPVRRTQRAIEQIAVDGRFLRERVPFFQVVSDSRRKFGGTVTITFQFLYPFVCSLVVIEPQAHAPCLVIRPSVVAWLYIWILIVCLHFAFPVENAATQYDIN